MSTKDYNQEIATKLWEFRTSLGIPRSQIAKKIGVSHQQFEKYEKGINRISAGTLAEIMQYFNISPEYFFNYENDTDYNEKESRMCIEISRNFLNIKKDEHRKILLLIAKHLANINNST